MDGVREMPAVSISPRVRLGVRGVSAETCRAACSGATPGAATGEGRVPGRRRLSLSRDPRRDAGCDEGGVGRGCSPAEVRVDPSAERAERVAAAEAGLVLMTSFGA